MAVATVGGIIKVTTIISIFIVNCACGFEIPEVTIQALKPKGIRVSLPDVPKTTLVIFQGNVNKSIKNNDVGTLSGEITNSQDGRWTYEDRNVELKVGDVISYYLFVSNDRKGYLKDNMNYTVKLPESYYLTQNDTADSNIKLVEPNSNQSKPEECKRTVTRIRVGTACSGQVIFEDNFDSLREDLWQIEQFIPKEQYDYPFVSYQKRSVTVNEGFLRISPKLQQDISGSDVIYSGELNLSNGCTGPAESCYHQAMGADIVPPVVSGKITSRAFAFTYGTIYIRAKLPKGDWLYPELLLEPLVNRYGSANLASGIVKIGCARGNELLTGQSDKGNKVIYGGPVIDTTCKEALLSTKISGTNWADEFHVYSVRWAPELITVSVDGEEYGRVEASLNGLRARLPPSCRDEPRVAFPPGPNVAPFDHHFYLTLGVAAGGTTEFDDGVVSQKSTPKPWKNSQSKAKFNFWHDIDNWLPTWSQPDLVVDYVKIVAL